MDRICRREGVDRGEAERLLDELDHNRSEFIRRNFRKDVNDPAHYDLVLDSSRLGVEGCVDVLSLALERLRLLRR